MPALSPEEGTSSNRYTILGRLAGGGMADIFLAKSASEGGVERYVVLKRVLAERSRDPVFASMFLDEARLAAQLQHPNIAQVHDIGRLAGCYFFTMEYVHGEDVRALLHAANTAKKIIPLGVALTIATSVLAALHHAHTRTGAGGVPLNIVHRDVSPSNVMVSYEGAIKLLDFGVAKAAQRTTESHSGAIKGKIAYLSPEQCRGLATIDRRSDIFAMGIVLHEMLTQRRLYKRDSDFEAMMSIVQDVPPLPSSIRPGLPPELDKVVMRALAKDPADRFATAADMLEALEAVAAIERLALSATACGRFLRELFGERPEPWLAPREADTEHTEVSATGSFSDVSIDMHDPALLSQLDHARPILRAPSTGPVGVPTAPIGVPTTPMMPIPREALDTAPMRPVVPDPDDLPPAPFAVASSSDAERYPQSGISTTPLPKPTSVAPLQAMPALPRPLPPSAASRTDVRARGPSARVGAIVVVAAACIGVGIAYLAMRGRGRDPDADDKAPDLVAKIPEVKTEAPVDIAQSRDAALKSAEAAREAAAQRAEAARDAAAKSADAAREAADAAREAATRSAEPPAKPKTIAELAADSAWPMVLDACAAEKVTDATTRATCATAACILDHADLARSYARGLSKKDRTPAETACKAQNIALTTVSVPAAPVEPKPKPRTPDPCELHPLECQK